MSSVISGSWQSQDFANLSAAGISGSFLLNTTDTLDGDLTVTGTITAQEFHTEFVSSSIIFTSGSTRWPGCPDDIHPFSGSINVKDAGHITSSGNISASGTITGNTASFSSIIGTLTSPSQTNITAVGNSVTVGTLNRKITLTGGNSFLASYPKIEGGNSSYILFPTGIALPDIQKLTFGSNLDNKYIAANGDQPEDLLIHANEDIILNPDNQVIVNSNISSSGTITATSFIGTMDGGSF